MAGLLHAAIEQFDQREVELCRILNRASRWRVVHRAFVAISRLGDGIFWYALMVVLPVVHGNYGLKAGLHMALTGAVGVIIYKLTKTRAVRERPFVTHGSVTCECRPLDRYSFPSGHTLHAVSFTIVACHYNPEWLPVLGVFAILVALSRVILGLHYPTDVAAGAFIGLVLSRTSLALAYNIQVLQ